MKVNCSCLNFVFNRNEIKSEAKKTDESDNDKMKKGKVPVVQLMVDSASPSEDLTPITSISGMDILRGLNTTAPTTTPVLRPKENPVNVDSSFSGFNIDGSGLIKVADASLFLKNMGIANTLFSYPSDTQRFYDTHSELWDSYGFGIRTMEEPSVCMVDLFKNHAEFDCSRAALSVLLMTALEKVGSAKFDSLFERNGIRITSRMPFYTRDIYMNGLIECHLLDSPSDIQVGDWLFLESSHDYLDKNPNGAFSGEHVIATKSKWGKVLFSGFLGEKNLMSYDQWLEYLADKANAGKDDMLGYFKVDGRIAVRRLNMEVFK
jgi:hypothetical protein